MQLSKRLERAGFGPNPSGSITGLFTVLVEGDDHDEPIANAVRGLQDGHIGMERSIAERGCHPAVDVLRSISRTMRRRVPHTVRSLLQTARELMSAVAGMKELIRLGAYRKGSDPGVDCAIAIDPLLTAVSRQ